MPGSLEIKPVFGGPMSTRDCPNAVSTGFFSASSHGVILALSISRNVLGIGQRVFPRATVSRFAPKRRPSRRFHCVAEFLPESARDAPERAAGLDRREGKRANQRESWKGSGEHTALERKWKDTRAKDSLASACPAGAILQLLHFATDTYTQPRTHTDPHA